MQVCFTERFNCIPSEGMDIRFDGKRVLVTGAGKGITY